MLQLPHSTQSLWRDVYPASQHPRLTEDITVDAVIVGSGITGLTCAYLLQQRGLSVAVLEKDTIGGGTTGRTTGKVTAQHNLIYTDLLKHHGRAVAHNYAVINQAAVGQVEQIINAEKLECDWRREDNYVFTTKQSSLDTFREEADVAASLGLPASYETTSPLPFSIAGAVKFTDQGALHAQRYLLGLAKVITDKGGFIFEQSNVIGIHKDSPCRIRTAHGAVQATDCIIATNVPTLPLAARGLYCAFEYPQESYIVAARVPQTLSGMYISSDEHEYSILPTIVDGEPYILLGGEGHLSGLRGSTKARYRRLAAYAESRFGATAITHRWSDRDYLAYDRLPLIGRLYPHTEHCYVASAFGKWGLSGGTAAALILTDLITQGRSSYETTFAPYHRGRVQAIPRAVGRYLRRGA